MSAQPQNLWRSRSIETVGFLLLVPWLALHASLMVTLLGLAPEGAAPAVTPEATTLILFVLPATALTLGMTGIHSMLFSGRVRTLCGSLVMLASLCLVGSVVGSFVHNASGPTAATAPLHGRRAG